MAVDAARVKELRERTGLPMMECKKALEKTAGDIEKAYDELRKAGHKAQAKLAGRSAKDGRVGAWVSPDGRAGALIALRCETEPVSKNAEFQALLGGLVTLVSKSLPKNVEALKASQLPSGQRVETALTELVNQIRENISLGRFARFEADAVIQYLHFDKKKGAMVAFKGGAAGNEKVLELGQHLGQHIVFHKPASLSREGLDPAVVEKEREILLAAARNDPKNAKKPDEILQKIISGQVEKFVASQCLLEQPCVRDEKQSVAKYIQSSGTGVTLVDFAYVATDVD
jgi:elongation factor Ts